jgi:hypothetical protein
MKAERLVHLGRQAGNRLRSALPKTVNVLQTNARRVGRRVAGGLRTLGHRVGTRLESSRVMKKARTSVGNRIHRTENWVRRNPYALPLVGLGSAAVALLAAGARRMAGSREPKVLKGALQNLGAAPSLRKGAGMILRRLLVGAATPGKPRVFRAVTIRW